MPGCGENSMTLCSGPWEQGLTQRGHRQVFVFIPSSLHHFIVLFHCYHPPGAVGGPSPPPWFLLYYTPCLLQAAAQGLPSAHQAGPEKCQRHPGPTRVFLAGSKECPGEPQGE